MALTRYPLDGNDFSVEISTPDTSYDVFSLNMVTGEVVGAFLPDEWVRILDQRVQVLFTAIDVTERSNGALNFLQRLLTVSALDDSTLSLSAPLTATSTYTLRVSVTAGTAPAHVVVTLPYSASGLVAPTSLVASGGGGPVVLSGDVTGPSGSNSIAAGVVTDTKVAAPNKDGLAAVPSMRTLGTGAQQACAGDDARLSNARTPTAHASTHLPSGSDPLTTAIAGAIQPDDTAAIGTADSFARSDHRHSIVAAAPAVLAVRIGNTVAEGVATSFARSDHQHAVTAGTPGSITDSTNSEGVSGTFTRSDHQHAHGNRSGGTLHAVATPSVAGFMSAADKTKLDGLGGVTDQPYDWSGYQPGLIASGEVLARSTFVRSFQLEDPTTTLEMYANTAPSGGYAYFYLVSSIAGTLCTIEFADGSNVPTLITPGPSFPYTVADGERLSLSDSGGGTFGIGSVQWSFKGKVPTATEIAYDFFLYSPGVPATSQVIWRGILDRAVTIESLAAESRGYAETAPGGVTTFNLFSSSLGALGSLVFNGSSLGAWVNAVPFPVTLPAGDRLYLQGDGNPVNAIADIYATIYGKAA